ncbi:MAG: outer membrane protein assembly factor BamB [Pseudomonadota bacterium]
MMSRRLVVAGLALTLSGCGLFGDKDEEVLEPLELQPIETTVNIKRAWTTRLGKGAENLRLTLSPSGDGQRLFVASVNGRVAALNPENGRTIWQQDVGEEISAGTAYGDDRVAVISKDGRLIVLDADTGDERWRSYISGESLARPLIRNGNVVVMTVDNRLRAYGLLDGNERWTLEESTPALTIRGNAAPVAVSNAVIAGFDNGRIMSVDLSSGDVQWQQMLSPPSGRSDLERLSDVDGHIAVVGQDVYAAGYQGRLAALAAESGQPLWAREISTSAGAYADFGSVYTVLDGGEIVAMSRRTGTETWRQESLLRREPTLPVSFMQTVATGDLEGYVHFFSSVTGEPVARVRASKTAVTSAPVAIASQLYVQADDGSLTAYVIPEPPRSRSAPDIADDDS